MSEGPCPLCNDEITQIVPHLTAEHPDLFIEGDGNERYAVYARLSQQGRRGSIATQIVDDLRYARKHDLPVNPDDIYNDGEHSSGFDPDEDRPDYDEVRQLISNGELTGVIIRDDKRLTRDDIELHRLFADLKEQGVELHVEETGQIDMSDGIESAINFFMSSVQNAEKEKEIKRAIRARAEKHARGEPLGVPPRGLEYSADKTRFIAQRDSDGSLSEEARNTVQAVLAKDAGASYTDVEDEYGIPRSTMHRLLSKHAEKYRRYSDEVQAEELPVDEDTELEVTPNWGTGQNDA